jgi:hypothetical protein
MSYRPSSSTVHAPPAISLASARRAHPSAAKIASAETEQSKPIWRPDVR